jgi:hypothetical protein
VFASVNAFLNQPFSANYIHMSLPENVAENFSACFQENQL